jgi:hypothetical protein
MHQQDAKEDAAGRHSTIAARNMLASSGKAKAVCDLAESYLHKLGAQSSLLLHSGQRHASCLQAGSSLWNIETAVCDINQHAAQVVINSYFLKETHLHIIWQFGWVRPQKVFNCRPVHLKRKLLLLLLL